MSCPSTHPTATDVTLRTQGEPGRLKPVLGPDGKNIIDRHPLRCWHGAGHKGSHGYGSITWSDVTPAKVHEAMMNAPHDGEPFRQARAAIKACR